ncbi:MAG: hypothetical protein FWD49_01290 [Firmicutes bacterium]|nr:hypothetical protein [Bacillota bacterium]
MDNIKQFEQDMLDIYREAKKIGYKPTIFLDMITTKGAIKTARYLINADVVSSGYTRLLELKRLDLTVESLVYEKWSSLFTEDEVKRCKHRLQDYDYAFKK